MRPVRTGPTARGALRHPAPCVREPRRHRRRWGAGALGGARHTRRCARGRGLPPGHRRPDAPRRGRRRARRHSAADCSLLCVRLPCVASSGRRGERRLAMGVASLRLVPADRPRRGHTAGLGPLAAHGGAGGGWTPRGGADRRHAAPSASELPGSALARGRAVRRLHDRGAGGHDRGATGTCRPRAGRGEAGRHQAVRSTLEQRHRDEGATAGAWVAEPPSLGRCARAPSARARAREGARRGPRADCRPAPATPPRARAGRRAGRVRAAAGAPVPAWRCPRRGRGARAARAWRVASAPRARPHARDARGHRVRVPGGEGAQPPVGAVVVGLPRAQALPAHRRRGWRRLRPVGAVVGPRGAARGRRAGARGPGAGQCARAVGERRACASPTRKRAPLPMPARCVAARAGALARPRAGHRSLRWADRGFVGARADAWLPRRRCPRLASRHRRCAGCCRVLASRCAASI